jgi:hypothetical protein
VFSRFKKELLDSDLDLKTSDVVEEEAVRLRVTARPGGPRILFGLFFAFPCLFLLWSAVTRGGFFAAILALLFCPILAVLSMLFGFGRPEKVFDRSRNVAEKSLRVFGHAITESEQIPAQGVVAISNKMVGGAKSTPGGHMKYTVRVSPCVGFGFVVYDHFMPASEFAGRLVRFLSYPLENNVPPHLRK